MTYQMKPLGCDPGRLRGLPEQLIIGHYENNYGGAVKRLNAICDQLAGLDPASAPVFVINGLKREQLIAMNSMIRHELNFDGLGAADNPGAALSDAIKRDFGSFERWRSEFVAIGKALHTHSVAGATPILALDMYEHSYHMDYGAKAAAYVDAYTENINWTNVAKLFGECRQ